jgi:ubiquinone/menaquinone biosynthesis C-methylase UbiE
MVGVAEDLPFENDDFDLVLLNDVIEHVVDPDIIMSEIRRIIKNEGLCLLSTPNLSAWFNRIFLMFGVQPIYTEVSYRKIYGRPGSDVVGHLRVFTYKAATEFIEDQNVSNLECEFSRFAALPKFTRVISYLFCKLSRAGDTMSFSFQFDKAETKKSNKL